MPDHIVWASTPDGQRVKIAECDTRELADLVAAALKAYKPAPVQEEANSNDERHTFKLGPVETAGQKEEGTDE